MALGSNSKTISICLDVDGFLRQNSFPDGYDIFQREDGTVLSPEEALTFLHMEKAMGHKVIPCSSECGNPCKHSDAGCTGFDYGGLGCPGRRAIGKDVT